MNQIGIEYWTGIGNRTLRAHIEAADTVCRFSVPDPLYGCAYEHRSYTAGYRYRGRAIGAAMDGDGRMYSMGATLVDEHGDELGVAGELRQDAFDRKHLLESMGSGTTS